MATDRLLTSDEALSYKARRDHYDLQTPLQAVVTNNQLLDPQFTRVRDPLLVKTC